jgi:colanic acid/amylovoran biosynthesis glycosyltransferase
VKRYLKKNNIKLVIAEFGTCGAEVCSLCQELKIPLIVIFHGYDAHRADIIEQYSIKYKILFAYSSAIVGVSNDILSSLKNLGAPKEKMFYLPCSFDESRFKYADHSNNEKIFLTVGRFCETKSPHLVLLAFALVLQKIPEAKLIMIGKDGGGELFEACHILVKSLKIENSVTFKGILSSQNVFEEMQKARVFVQHSVTTPLVNDKEGTPVSVVEAMACGLPVIATRHAGIAEIIQNNNSGILVEEYDYKTMANEMIRVCNDDKLAYQLGKNAAESIRENEYFSKNIEKLADLIEMHRIK